MKIKTLKFLLLLFAGLLFVNCSSTNSFQRYKQNNNVEVKENNSIRFSSADTQYVDMVEPDISLDSINFYKKELIEEGKKSEEKYFSSFNKIDMDTSISIKDKLMMKIIELRDAPYKFGGNTKEGIDCSAFTRLVFSSTFDFELPRSAREQYQIGDKIVSLDSLEIGDLVFFNTSRRRKPGHVGIYLGENLFVHASSSLGVTISSMDEKYYAKRYMSSRRIKDIKNKL